MNIHIATDHAGLEIKETISNHLKQAGHNVVDHGAYKYNTEDDYPDFIVPCAEAVIGDPGSLGVVIGGSGNGEQIAANKVRDIRAALVWSEETARLARQHNNANVISIGARMHSQEDILKFIDIFVSEPFSGDDRHVRRLGKISDYENKV